MDARIAERNWDKSFVIVIEYYQWWYLDYGRKAFPLALNSPHKSFDYVGSRSERIFALPTIVETVLASSSSLLGIFLYFVLPKHTFSCARSIFFCFENVLLFTYFCMLYEYHIICYCCFLPRLPPPPWCIKSGRHAVCNVCCDSRGRSECVCMYKEHVVPSQFQVFNVIINLNDFIMLRILNFDAFRLTSFSRSERAGCSLID